MQEKSLFSSQIRRLLPLGGTHRLGAPCSSHGVPESIPLGSYFLFTDSCVVRTVPPCVEGHRIAENLHECENTGQIVPRLLNPVAAHRTECRQSCAREHRLQRPVPLHSAPHRVLDGQDLSDSQRT